MVSTSAVLIGVLATLYNYDLRESLWLVGCVVMYAILGIAIVQMVLEGLQIDTIGFHEDTVGFLVLIG